MKVMIHKNVCTALGITIVHFKEENFRMFVDGKIRNPVQWMIRREKLPNDFIGTVTLREWNTNYTITADDDEDEDGAFIYGKKIKRKVWEINGTGSWTDNYAHLEMSGLELSKFRHNRKYTCSKSPWMDGEVVIYFTKDLAWWKNHPYE